MENEKTAQKKAHMTAHTTAPEAQKKAHTKAQNTPEVEQKSMRFHKFLVYGGLILLIAVALFDGLNYLFGLQGQISAAEAFRLGYKKIGVTDALCGSIDLVLVVATIYTWVLLKAYRAKAIVYLRATLIVFMLVPAIYCALISYSMSMFYWTPLLGSALWVVVLVCTNIYYKKRAAMFCN